MRTNSAQGENIVKETIYRQISAGYSGLMEYTILALAFFLPLSLRMSTVLLIFGIFLWLAKMLVCRQWEFQRTPFDETLFFLVFLGLTSALVSADRGFSLYNFVHLMGRYLGLYFLISYNVTSRQQLKQVVYSLLASSVVVALYGFYQYILGVDISAFEWVDSDQFPDLKVRIFSTLENPNLLAGFMVMMIGLGLGLGLGTRDWDKKILLLIFILLMSGCLVLTYSRGAWVSLLAVILAYGLLCRRWVLWLLLAVPLAALCTDDVYLRLVSILHPTDTSSTLRFALWESTLAMIHDRPLLGFGWGTYWMVYPHYDFFIQDPSIIIFHAHNMYLHMAAETGIPGLAAFLILMGYHAKMAFTLYRSKAEPWVSGLSAGILAAFFGIAVNGMTDHVLFSVQMSMLFWFFNAMVLVLWRTAEPKKIYKDRRGSRKNFFLSE